jgi:plastocyanin
MSMKEVNLVPIEKRASGQTRRTRRRALQALAVVTGSLLVFRAGVTREAPFALAQDEDDADDDDSGHGRGRGRGRGGDDDHDNSGHGNAEDRDGDLAQTADVPPGSLEVRIVGDDAGDFVPGELTVDAGQSVTFVNAHSDEHTATGSGFDTGIIPEGSTATVTLESPGRFPYACQIHPEMTGVILVRGEDGTVPEQPAQTAQDVPADAPTVRIVNLAFDPAEITVPTGATVVWTNEDTPPHTVTSLDGVFDSGIFDPGASFSWTFDQPGTFPYQCLLHPQMQGTVIVIGEGAAAAPAADATIAPAQTGEEQPAAESADVQGVWVAEFTPDDTSLLSAQTALVTLHGDGLVAVSFAGEGQEASSLALESGHGEWSSEGGSLEMMFVAMATGVDQHYVGNVVFEAQGQVTPGDVIDGTFTFAIASGSGQVVGNGAGGFRGERFVVEMETG